MQKSPTPGEPFLLCKSVLAGAISLQKGEAWEWSMEDKTPTFFRVLKKREDVAGPPKLG